MGIILDYPGRANITTRVIIRETGGSEAERGNVTTEAEVELMYFEGSREGSMSQEIWEASGS